MSPLDQALVDVVVQALRPELAAIREEVAALRRAQPPQMISIDQAAARLGLSRTAVKKLIKDGRLATTKLGSRVCVDLSTVLATKAKGEG